MNKLTINALNLKDKEEIYSFDLINNLNVNVDKETVSNLYLLVNVLKSDKEININIKENSNVKIVIITTGDFSYALNIDLSNDASLSLFTADSLKNDVTINKTINLNGKNSNYKCYEYLSSLNNKVTGSFVVNHLNENTSAYGKFIYLASKNGYINRNVESYIEKGMKDSNSSENIKGVILDSSSRIDAKPILKIDYDDVHASHGCAIGTIDSNEIYYLMSRGLTKEDALKIICKSLINPIFREIKDEEFLNETKNILERTIGE